MNFSNLKEWSTPRGNVVELAIDGKVAWKKVMGVPISTLPVGSSVFMNVDGVSTEFLVVHHGLPSSRYDSSCNGSWLLMKDLYVKKAWDSSNNDYQNSDIHTYLNGTFLGLLDSDIQSAIKQVKIPYKKGTGSVASGSNGLSTKIFLLSAYEAGWTTSTITGLPVDGTRLSYFSSISETGSERIGYYDGTAANWWLRSPHTDNTYSVWFVNSVGGCNNAPHNTSYGVRPALILPSETLVDTYFNVIA